MNGAWLTRCRFRRPSENREPLRTAALRLHGTGLSGHDRTVDVLVKSAGKPTLITHSLRWPVRQIILQGGRTGVGTRARIEPSFFLAYCLAVAILVLMPGPIVTLIVANSLSHGSRLGLATVAGASIGNAILLGATAVGLVAFFALLSEIFQVVRWVGAAYLIWLGIKAWQVHRGEGLAIAPAAKRSSRAVFLQGLLIAITNPKAIVFYIAFLPQFVDSELPATPASRDDRNDDRHGPAL